MDDQTIIFLLAAIMFAGALAFGYIPLGFRFSHARLEQFMALGAGVLIGSAFLVIIPEGLETIKRPLASRFGASMTSLCSGNSTCFLNKGSNAT